MLNCHPCDHGVIFTIPASAWTPLLHVETNAPGQIDDMIEHIEIRNYRAFKSAVFSDVSQLSVLIGANGSGKSTFFDVILFLKDALQGTVKSAVTRRGGFREIVSRGQHGPISITIKFRTKNRRLATYILEISHHDGQVFIEKEILRYRRGSRGRPWHFVDFSNGKGLAITNESVYGQAGAQEEREEFELGDPSTLAIKGLGQFAGFPIVSEFRNMIEHWHISNFHISEARKISDFGYSEHLSSSGDNIAQAAKFMYDNHRGNFNKILDNLRNRVPGVQNVEARTTEDGRLILRFQDEFFSDPFVTKYVSDGTIKMFAYLILLNDPNPHPLLAIEEPENQLYPSLLEPLIEEFRGYAASGGQVFVSTHSSEFLSGADLSEIYVLKKVKGFSSVYRPKDSNEIRSLIALGERPSSLWRQGLFEGLDS